MMTLILLGYSSAMIDPAPKEQLGAIAMVIYLYYQTCIDMSLKTKIINLIAAHPTLVMFGIGLAITFAIPLNIQNYNHANA
jgi:hypothetical protein